MSEKALQILDNSLRYSLWAFLAVLAVILTYLLIRRSQRGVNPVKSALHGVVLAAITATVFFLAISLTPFSFFENFASTRELREEKPLRLTALIYERRYEGFTLQGEVWNQSGSPVENLQAEIRIWGANNNLLDRVLVPVEPVSLPPGQAGSFNTRYDKNSPFLYGYEVAFLSADGKVIPYVKGFDVH